MLRRYFGGIKLRDALGILLAQPGHALEFTGLGQRHQVAGHFIGDRKLRIRDGDVAGDGQRHQFQIAAFVELRLMA